MNIVITSKVLQAYSLCPRKAFLLMYGKEKGTVHEYEQILIGKQIENQLGNLDLLKQKQNDVYSYSVSNLEKGRKFLINANLTADNLRAFCPILARVEKLNYEPKIFIGTHTISNIDRLKLLFIGYVLAKIQGRSPKKGYIVNIKGESRRLKLDESYQVFIRLLETLQEWSNNSSIEEPPIFLNKHCHICQFKEQCMERAIQEDNLSLLDRVTPKIIRQYEKKGIFTIKQLSYLFKPRKRKKRRGNPPPVIHKRELQALAIREQKIYLKESPELFRQPTEIFLDIEGNPDTQFYYLIGILACQMNSSEYTAFWANTQQDEEQVWNNFLATITQYPKAPIYHYGNYEVKIITKLAKRYGTVIDHLYKQLINVNHFIYGKVYFPAYSNSLKDIGRSIGAKWTSPKASGIQTLVWRHYWEETADTKYKELLLTYNKEDCQALKLLTDELIKISNSAEKLSDVEFADKHKRPKTEVEKQIHTQLRTVLNFSYLQYDKKKIHFRQEEEKEDSETKKARNRNKRKQLTQKLLDINRRVQKTIEISPQTVCPQCGSLQLRPYDKETHRVIIDLKLTRNGLKKTIIRFTGSYQYCIKCYTLCPPPFKYKQSQIYGHGLKAWIVYHRIALRLPYESISESFQEQFKEKIATGSLSRFIHDLAVYYSETENILIQHLLESPFIHVDETKINIQGENWYVWVFTDIKYTILKLQETREATIIHSLLADYSGILISDFYSGYDSVKCAQQKCWVHLIGDLNNDLWESPFDSELESFVLHVKDLIIPIMECIQKYGLRRRNLRKFEKNVDRFYKNFIIDVNYNSDIVSKYQKRFIRYRESLFTFLKHDGILWHNNPAEWAIRPIAKQRSISSSFSSSIAEAYLILLGIRQTCRSQGKSFFKFLFSGQKNLDLFEVRKQKKNEY